MNQKEKSEETRQAIIEEATKLFVKKGFYGTSISDLSKTVGMTKGAIYHHFENKDSLCLAVVNHVAESWELHVGKYVLQENDPENQLQALFDRHGQHIKENPHLCLVMNGLVIELEDSNENLMGKIRSIYNEFALLLRGIIVAGQKRGVFRSDLNAQLMAMNIVGAIRGNSCSHLFTDIEHDYLEKMSTLRDMIVGGLKRKS